MPFANEYYRVSLRSQVTSCCDEIQMRYTCRKCSAEMGCYYCDFDYNKAHDCNE